MDMEEIIHDAADKPVEPAKRPKDPKRVDKENGWRNGIETINVKKNMINLNQWSHKIYQNTGF